MNFENIYMMKQIAFNLAYNIVNKKVLNTINIFHITAMKKYLLKII